MKKSSPQKNLIRRHLLFPFLFVTLGLAIVIGTAAVAQQQRTYSLEAASSKCPGGKGGPGEACCPTNQLAPNGRQCRDGNYNCQNGKCVSKGTLQDGPKGSKQAGCPAGKGGTGEACCPGDQLAPNGRQCREGSDNCQDGICRSKGKGACPAGKGGTGEACCPADELAPNGRQCRNSNENCQEGKCQSIGPGICPDGKGGSNQQCCPQNKPAPNGRQCRVGSDECNANGLCMAKNLKGACPAGKGGTGQTCCPDNQKADGRLCRSGNDSCHKGKCIAKAEQPDGGLGPVKTCKLECEKLSKNQCKSPKDVNGIPVCFLTNSGNCNANPKFHVYSHTAEYKSRDGCGVSSGGGGTMCNVNCASLSKNECGSKKDTAGNSVCYVTDSGKCFANTVYWTGSDYTASYQCKAPPGSNTGGGGSGASPQKVVKNAQDQIDQSNENIKELKNMGTNGANQRIAVDASIKANQRIISVDKKIIKNPKDTAFINRAHDVISAYNKMYRLAGELYQDPDSASKKTALKNAEAAADKLYAALMASKPKDDDPTNTTPPAIAPPASPNPGSVGFPPAGGGGGGGAAPAPGGKTPTAPTAAANPTATVTTAPKEGDVTLKLSLRFQGITKQPKDNSMNVKVSLDTNHQATGIFTADSTGVWTGEVKFTKVDLNQKHSIFVKGPKHLQKRICKASPTESTAGTYSCSTNEITLKEGINTFNFSNILLLAGDLPEQDGVVDSSDITFIVVNLGSTDPEDLEIGDVNLDGVINTQDFALILAALAVKEEDSLN